MTLELYTQLTAEIGISRGKLATGFPPEVDTESTVPKRKELVSQRAEVKPPIVEDLSRFVKKQPPQPPLTKLYLCSSKTRSFYESIYRRGVTIAMLSEKVGASTSVLHRCINGDRVRPSVKSALIEFLTAEECKSLGWEVGK